MILNLQTNAADVAALFQQMPTQFRGAAVETLNRTANAIKREEISVMASVLDRPTPFTLNGLFIDPARPTRLQAEVFFKDVYRSISGGSVTGSTGWHYLLPQVEGGGRRFKQLERALQLGGMLPAGWYVTPGRFMKLDSFGNMDRGQITQILSQLRVQLTAGYSRSLPAVRGNERKVIGALRRAGGRYFAVPPGRKGIAPGVYLREFIGNKAPMPVLKFVQRVSYSKRFPFYETAQAVVDRDLARNLDQALQALLPAR